MLMPKKKKKVNWQRNCPKKKKLKEGQRGYPGKKEKRKKIQLKLRVFA